MSKYKESSPVSELVERLRDAETWLSASGDIQSDASARAVSEAADRLIALEAENAKLKAERIAIRNKIPMDYLMRYDVPGAYGPTGALDLVAAVKDFSDDRWKLIDKLRIITESQGGDHGE